LQKSPVNLGLFLQRCVVLFWLRCQGDFIGSLGVFCGDLYMYIQMVYGLYKSITNSVVCAKVIRIPHVYMYIVHIYTLKVSRTKSFTNTVVYTKVLRIPHVYMYIVHIYTLRIPIKRIGVCFIRMRHELCIQSI